MTRLPYTRETCTLTSDTGNGRIAPILISFNAAPGGENNLWFFGRVKDVRNDGREITVRQILANKRDMKGYSFWKAAGNKVHLDEAAQQKMDVLEKWHAKPVSDRVYKFIVDDAVGVFLNGKMEGVTHQNLTAGDFVSIEVNVVQAAKDVMFPNAIRITRP